MRGGREASTMEEKDEERIMGKEWKEEWLMKRCTDMVDSGGLKNGGMK